MGTASGPGRPSCRPSLLTPPHALVCVDETKRPETHGGGAGEYFARHAIMFRERAAQFIKPRTVGDRGEANRPCRCLTEASNPPIDSSAAAWPDIAGGTALPAETLY